MKKRTIIKFFSFFFAGMLALLGLFLRFEKRNEDYRIRLSNVYMQSISSLCDSLSNINVELKKTTYVTTPEKISLLAAQIYHESGAVMSALSQLPAGEEDMSPVYKFISQVGDYTLAISKKAISGEQISADERENLNTLADTAEKLSLAVEEMRINYENGNGMSLEIEGGAENISMSSSLAEIRDSVLEYPTLIYDGPYSDHILEGESQMLNDAREITVTEAIIKAASALGVAEDKLTMSGEAEGKLPAYRFDTEDTTIAVTKRGGYILYFRKYRPFSGTVLSYEQAVQVASNWLSEKTNLTFKESYYFADEGVCTVNFAYKEGSTVCYTDLIKVGVALDTGEIVLCEANGYIMNHTARTIKTPSRTEEEARSVVSDALGIISSQRTLIPSDGGNEIPCYEFRCTDTDGEEVLVYINQEDLSEERVYLVLKTDGGTLTK